MGKEERKAKRVKNALKPTKAERQQSEWDATKKRQGNATDAAFARHGGRPKHGEVSGKGPRLGIRKPKKK